MVKFLIGKGAKVNAIGPNGHTAFMLAASQGRTENMKLLLAAGADPDAIARDEDGLQYDATFLVKQSGNPEAVALVEEAQKNSKQAALKP
jgi:ankyrin repeat protein